MLYGGDSMGRRERGRWQLSVQRTNQQLHSKSPGQRGEEKRGEETLIPGEETDAAFVSACCENIVLVIFCIYLTDNNLMVLMKELIRQDCWGMRYKKKVGKHRHRAPLFKPHRALHVHRLLEILQNQMCVNPENSRPEWTISSCLLKTTVFSWKLRSLFKKIKINILCL